MNTWYEELKFDTNPLDTRPNSNLVGLDKETEKLKNHILKEELCFLNGLTGSGKTSLLLKIQNELKRYKFIYLDAQDLPPDFNLEQELKKKRSFFDKITFKQFPRKKPVLLIDEFQSTNPNLILEARGKWESQDRKIKSIVIAQISKYLNNVSDSFKDRLGNRIMTLKPIDDFDMRKVLKNRLYNKKTKFNYIKKFDEKAIDLIIKVADGNVRRLLEYTDMIFDFHHSSFKEINPIGRDSYHINYYAVKEILERNNINVEGFEQKAKPTKKHLPFEKLFSEKQQRMLRLLLHYDRITIDDIAKKLKISLSSANNLLFKLRKKNAIVKAGKKERKRLWAIAPSTKRLMAKV
ncbi:MAG: AAA family ATPase [Nanoarchaeota archaeon]|nr:AAA family ATPase [Nanoarchaeota archaeon]MBU4492976.1 AAA family ATPase [Nanoarchaeota archaeon]